MKADKNGWGAVPALDEWTCPVCGTTSDVDGWIECEVGCEDCGSHEARECPKCGERYDFVFGDEKIAQASKMHREDVK